MSRALVGRPRQAKLFWITSGGLIAASVRIRAPQREREVLQLVAKGRTIRGIANIPDIACRTVVFHKSNLMDKLGFRITAELTRYAIQYGL